MLYLTIVKCLHVCMQLATDLEVSPDEKLKLALGYHSKVNLWHTPQEQYIP